LDIVATLRKHIIKNEGGGACFGELLWWAARTSNPVDAAKRSGSIPPPERFLQKTNK